MLQKLLITGAGGSLGAVCRTKLQPIAKTIRLGVRNQIGEAAAHEEIICCDIGDKVAVEELVDGCDGIVHLAGQANEAPWETIRNANIDGMMNLYEAARKSSVTPRIVFASSNHAIGFYEQNERIDASAMPRPDGLYGVSKVFGEALARMYFDKFGIETACVRIGSCFPKPTNHRMLATWMSHDDFIRLIERVFSVPRLGCPIIYGASDNSASWWDNHETSYLGWSPQDSADVYREHIEATIDRPAVSDVNALYHGGSLCGLSILEDK